MVLAMTDDAARDAAPSLPQDQAETETAAAEPRVRTGLARLQAPGGAGVRQAAARQARAETETETQADRDADVRASNRRRRGLGGIFAPVEPEARKLTRRQETFARNVAAGLSPTVSARLAGFKAVNEASRLRQAPQVRAAIQRYRDLRLSRLSSAAPGVLADIMLNPDEKASDRAKIAIWLLESQGHGPKTKQDREKDNDNNDMREWSIEALEAFLAERDRSRRQAIATDVAVIVPDGTVETQQPLEKTQETHPSQDRGGEEEGGEPA